jgi:hypothetical protein
MIIAFAYSPTMITSVSRQMRHAQLSEAARRGAWPLGGLGAAQSCPSGV